MMRFAMKISKQLGKMNNLTALVLLLCLTVGASAEGFTPLSTADNALYQLSVRLIDFPDNTFENDMLLDNSTTHQTKSLPGLLSGFPGEDGYPMNRDGVSIAPLFEEAFEVNHLFLTEPLQDGGIWEFDSAQCFAALNGADFTLYRELGTIDTPSATTMDHGQFLPFNTITSGYISACHPANTYDVLGGELPDDDPRNGEPLYAIPANEANHYFGLALDAAFTIPQDALDTQGQDLIASFTADDDLWVYIDDYLILDLGGIHSAIPGSINFSTGTVTYRDEDGKDSTIKLYKLFQQRFMERYPEAHGRDVQDFIEDLFTENSHWQSVFKENTTHTLKLIYLERGAGASNLHIRFNLPVLPK